MAGMMALPMDYPPVRVADTYSADETVVAQVATKKKVGWDAGLNIGQVSSGRQLPSNDWGAFIFPSLLRHTVTYTVLTPGTAAIPWSYKAVRSVSSSVTNFTIPSLESTWRVDFGGFVATPGQLQPHGNTLFCGRADGRVGVWADAMNAYPCTFTTAFVDGGGNPVALPASTNCTMTIYRWGNGRWAVTGNTGVVAGAINVSVNTTQAGYYALELAFAGGQVPGILCTFTMSCTTTSSWAHAPVNDIYANWQNIGNHRVLGLSVLLQNEASVMNKQGNVLAFQSPPNSDWYQSYPGKGGGANFYQNVFEDKNTTSFLLETGIYGFKRPKGSQDFNWETEILLGDTNQTDTLAYLPANQLTQVYFQLSCPCDYLCVAASASQVGAADCLMTTAVGLEYTTTNSWLEAQTPVIAKQAFELGIASLREVEQFYENPLHIPSLMDAISTGMQTMAPLVGFLPGIGPTLATGAMMGGQVVRQLKNAIYGDASDNSQTQGENRAIKSRQKAVRRRNELEAVVEDGRMNAPKFARRRR